MKGAVVGFMYGLIGGPFLIHESLSTKKIRISGLVMVKKNPGLERERKKDELWLILNLFFIALIYRCFSEPGNNNNFLALIPGITHFHDFLAGYMNRQ